MGAHPDPTAVPGTTSRTSLPRDSELPSLTNAPVAPETRKGRRIALAVVLVIAFLAVAWIASPLWVGIVLGTVMAFTTQPTYRRIVQRVGEQHRHLASAVVTLASGVLLLVSGALAIYVVVGEAVLVGGWLRTKMASGSLEQLVGHHGARLVDQVGLDRAEVMDGIHRELSNVTARATEVAAVLLQDVTSALLGLVIALVTMYYVLIEWPRIATRLENVLPLDPRHTRALMLEFRDVGRSAFVGTVATAIVQGVLGGVGYWIAGVPQPITWGLFTAFASFLPVVGTAIVWGAIAGYCAFTGHLVRGVVVLAWGALIVSALCDYVIRPWFVGKKGHGHPMLMLVALLGGIEVMGLAGLFVAPVVMSLFLAVLRIYEREVQARVGTATTPRDLAARTPPPMPLPSGAASSTSPPPPRTDRDTAVTSGAR